MLTTVHYLPVACFILFPCSFVITYIIAIQLGHCEVFLPYISDTGIKIPERCIFSQLFNIVSVLVALTILIRYKQVEQQCKDFLAPDTNKVLTLNKVSVYVGLISAMGISIVANFQELQLLVIHFIGAFTGFGFGLVYCALQTRISYSMFPIVKSGLFLARCRLALTLILILSFIVSTVMGILAYIDFRGLDIINWQSSDGGYLFHVISASFEWIAVMAIDFYILSFAHEFKYMSISSPKFYMISTVNYIPDELQNSEPNN